MKKACLQDPFPEFAQEAGAVVLPRCWDELLVECRIEKPVGIEAILFAGQIGQIANNGTEVVKE